jgi:hypothetical protein
LKKSKVLHIYDGINPSYSLRGERGKRIKENENYHIFTFKTEVYEFCENKERFIAYSFIDHYFISSNAYSFVRKLV